jgi:hypothetical protein
MIKTVIVSLAIVTASTSAALAWTHHSRAAPRASAAAIDSNRSARSMNAYAAMPAPAAAGPGVRSKDYDMYMKNLHDSGYDPKKDFMPDGNIRQK